MIVWPIHLAVSLFVEDILCTWVVSYIDSFISILKRFVNVYMCADTCTSIRCEVEFFIRRHIYVPDRYFSTMQGVDGLDGNCGDGVGGPVHLSQPTHTGLIPPSLPATAPVILASTGGVSPPRHMQSST